MIKRFKSDFSDNKVLDDNYSFLMMVKCHIDKAKYPKFKPNCNVFSSDFLLLLSSLQIIYIYFFTLFLTCSFLVL